MEDFIGLPDDYHRPRRVGMGGLKRGSIAAGLAVVLGGLAWILVLLI